MRITLFIGIALIVIGLWAMLTRRNIIKIIIGFSIIDTGVHLIIVSLGYLKNATAPIFTDQITPGSVKVVDPVPSALVLTAIVIGLAVTAVMLAYAINMVKSGKSLSIDDYKELKW